MERYLSNPLSTLLTELGGVAKVLNKVWQQTQDVEGEACTQTRPPSDKSRPLS